MSGEASMTNGTTKLIIKDSKMTTLSSAEDMGFCSGEDFYMENEVHSPTDSSEDSLEVKIGPISLKNKRKLFEPRKTDGIFTGPLKKRMCLKVKAEAAETTNNISTPFRPWSPPQTKTIIPTSTVTSGSNNSSDSFVVPYPVKREVVASPAPSSYFRPPSPLKYYEIQSEPVSLVTKKREDDNKSEVNHDIRVPVHPQVNKLSTAETERIILKTAEQFPALQQKQLLQPEQIVNCFNVPAHTSTSSSSSGSNKKIEQRREQRNYKNMTRERRIEANARERTRVHTISAAFETLRHAVPAYSHNQKLSKLSVLRIACSYIMTLSSLLDSDVDSNETTAECVESVSRTIQREGKLRKKKDDND